MYLPFYSEIKDIVEMSRYIKAHGGFIYGLKCVWRLR